MSTPLQDLHAFVLAESFRLPAARRARIYRALADIVGDEVAARELIQLAMDLEAIDRRSRQLLLNLGGQA
jgi:hypothetical protein